MRTPSLKLNVLASYASQIYLIVISIAILPVYMKYMGAESYGLVGFFAMIQGLFSLLDFGLTPTISRQTAQYNAGVETAINFRRLYRTLNIIFIAIALGGGGALFILNDLIALHWLKIENLNLTDVLICLQIMAICVALRWMTGLYRGVISGFEQIVWLSITNVIIATLRFLGVLIFMYYFGYNIKNFFIFQLIVAVFEFILLLYKSNILMPKIDDKDEIGWSLEPIKPLIGFALTIAVTSSIWVLMTQLDKFLLSGILPLSEYGYFTLAVLVAGGILQISMPINSVIMPRMARLNGEKKFDEVRQVYLNATQFIAVIVVTAGIVLAILAEQVLYVWTGDIQLSKNAAPILQLYALGNAVLALGSFPYFLQYAKGNLKYHFIGNIVSAIILIPTIIWAAKTFGAIGAGWTWLVVQIIYLVVWVSFVHSKIEPGINIRWYSAFLPSVVLSTSFALIISHYLNYSENRFFAFMQISSIGLFSLIIAAMGSDKIRNILKSKILKSHI